MTSPADVVAFHADYDKHPDDRVRLFRAVAGLLPRPASVLYAGSYIDIAPSIWFDDVLYVDVDKRAARFFAQEDAVAELVRAKRRAGGQPVEPEPTLTFEHADFEEPLPVQDGSVDVLISMYAGFISEHCTRYLRTGGYLVTNNSHGDASMASLDPDYTLVAVINSSDGDYQADTDDLDRYLVPKKGTRPTIEELHEMNRGAAYTHPAFVYVFRRTPPR